MSKEDFQVSPQYFEDFQTLIDSIEQAETDSFFDLAKILGRDPKKDFVGADLSGTNLSLGDLISADLSNANLTGADLSNADLSNANLTGADLSNTNLRGANLTGADLSNTNLRGADINNATKLDDKQYFFWKNTQTLVVKKEKVNNSSDPLRGEEFLQKVKGLKNLSREKKATVCGYYTVTKSNEKRVNLMKFLNALIDAEGIELDTNPNFKEHKKRKLISQIITVQSNGELIISSACVKQMGLQPGDEFEITLGRKHIHLKMLQQGAILIS